MSGFNRGAPSARPSIVIDLVSSSSSSSDDDDAMIVDASPRSVSPPPHPAPDPTHLLAPAPAPVLHDLSDAESSSDSFVTKAMKREKKKKEATAKRASKKRSRMQLDTFDELSISGTAYTPELLGDVQRRAILEFAGLVAPAPAAAEQVDDSFQSSFGILIADIWDWLVLRLRYIGEHATIGRIACVSKGLAALVDRVLPERFHASVSQVVFTVSLTALPLFLTDQPQWRGVTRGVESDNDEEFSAMFRRLGQGVNLLKGRVRLIAPKNLGPSTYLEDYFHSPGEAEASSSSSSSSKSAECHPFELQVDAKSTIDTSDDSARGWTVMLRSRSNGSDTRNLAEILALKQGERASSELAACVLVRLSPLVTLPSPEAHRLNLFRKPEFQDYNAAVMTATVLLDTRRYGRLLATNPAKDARFSVGFERTFCWRQRNVFEESWRWADKQRSALVAEEAAKKKKKEFAADDGYAHMRIMNQLEEDWGSNNVDDYVDYYPVRLFPEGAHYPRRTFDPTTLPLYNLEACGLKMVPHGYQVAAVSWMMHLEREYIAKGYEFVYSDDPVIAWGSSADLVVVGGDRLAARPSDGQRALNMRRTFTTEGGVLADEMGLGKTLETLSLVAMTRPAIPPKLRTEPFSATNTEYLATRATLLVVPNGLVNQVIEQAETLFGADYFRILVLTDMTTHAAITYNDVRSADIVLVTLEFFYNGYKHTLPVDYAENVLRNEKIRHIRQELLPFDNKSDNEEALAATPSPLLELFRWQRLIVDEAAAVITPPKTKGAHDYLGCFQEIEAKARWVVSATLGSSVTDIVRLADFLRIRDTGASIFSEAHLVPARGFKARQGVVSDLLAQNQRARERGVSSMNIRQVYRRFGAFKEHCVWRQTQSNVERYYPRVVYTMTHQLVSLAKDERLAYESALILHEKQTSQYKRDTLLLAAASTVFAISDDFVSATRANLSGRRWTEVQAEVRTAQAKLRKYRDQEAVVRGKLNARGVRYSPEYAIHQAELLYWREKSEEIEELLTRLAKAGALAREVGTQYKALLNAKLVADPKYAMRESELVRSLRLPMERQGEWTRDRSMEQLYDALVEYYGTKAASAIAYLLRVLSRDPEARVLVFSRRTNIFDAIADAFGPTKVIVLEGSVFAKRKARTGFIGGKAPILLLNIDTQSSGLHLVEASHVLLLDPVRDAGELARERQAIGRAVRQGQTKQVQVTRLVLRDTVEEPLSRGYHAVDDADFAKTILGA